MNKASALSCPIREQALKHPRMPALCDAGGVQDYASLDAAIEQYRAMLGAQHCKAGDRILLTGTPSSAYCALLWACFREGITACPVNSALPSAAMEHWARFTGAAAVYGEHADLLPPSLPRLLFSGTFQETEEENPGKKLPLNGLQHAVIIQTSGSTGTARGAVLTLSAVLAAAGFANQNMPLRQGDRWLVTLPFFHVSGLSILFRCAAAGACAVFPEAGSTLAQGLLAHDATHLSLVPTQLQRLLDDPEAVPCLRKMKGVLLGGAPMPESLLRRAFEAGIPLIPSYGMTETAAQCCAVPPGSDFSLLQTSGRPLQPGSMRIDERGMIQYNGDALFQGYLQGDGSLHLPLSTDGWFPTGDCGFFDEAGFLHVNGRADSMIICGGENIHPEEIEQLLCTAPGIRRVLVSGVTHAEYGTIPVAFIDPEDGAAIDEVFLRRYLAERLPRFKHPRRFLRWPDAEPGGLKASRSWFASEAERLLEEK